MPNVANITKTTKTNKPVSPVVTLAVLTDTYNEFAKTKVKVFKMSKPNAVKKVAEAYNKFTGKSTFDASTVDANSLVNKIKNDLAPEPETKPETKKVSRPRKGITKVSIFRAKMRELVDAGKTPDRDEFIADVLAEMKKHDGLEVNSGTETVFKTWFGRMINGKMEF